MIRYPCGLVIHLFPLLEIVCKFQTFVECGQYDLIPVFYCIVLNKDLEGFFPPTNFVVFIKSFYVHKCGELWVFMNCVGSILSLSHIVFSPLLSYFLLFLLRKKYCCYFYILHLWILAINKTWKWKFLCVGSTNKSPTHILPLVHVSFILYCSFGFCGQLHFHNGHHLLPSSGRYSL